MSESKEEEKTGVSSLVVLPRELDKEVKHYMIDNNIETKPEAIIRLLEERFCLRTKPEAVEGIQSVDPDNQ